jgi:hypothetical protein
MIILLFMALFAQFAFVIPSHPVEMCLGYASIIFGALLWWYSLTWVIDIMRNKFDELGVIIINRIIGGAVMIFSVIALMGTLFNIYVLPKF